MFRKLILPFFIPICLLILVFAVIKEPAAHALNVSGPITSDTTWTVANSPYIITSRVEIEPGVTLTIEAGVEVQVVGPGFAAIWVKEGAHLEAVGTEVAPIIFTSVAESGPSDWTALGVTGSARFIHTEFRNSLYNLDINGASGGPIILEDSLINHSAYGLDIEGVDSFHRLQMNNVQFINNDANVVRIDTYGADSFSESSILSFQPGLDGYLIVESGSGFSDLTIPENITLTLEAGVTLFHDWVRVAGHLQANGTVVSPTKIVGKTEPIGIVVEETGSLLLENTHLSNGGIGIGLSGNSSEPVVIRNSKVISKEFPFISPPSGLHRFQMDNVTFENNINNGVMIDIPDGNELIDDVVLTDELGMEGYYLQGCGWYTFGCTSGTLTVPQGITLTLEPNVRLIANQDASVEIDVAGSLIANGTLTEPNTITASQNDIWKGLVVNAGSVELNHTDIQDANIGIHVLSGTVEIEDSQIISSTQAGIRVEGGTVTAVCTQFRNNQTGIHVPESASPTVSVSQSVFDGNNVGVWNLGNTAVSATNNWWGTANGPDMGMDVIGDVTVAPWLLWEPACISQIPDYQTYLPMVIRP